MEPRKISDVVLIYGQLLVTGAMTGIVWLVQLVVYPQFLHISESTFEAYHAGHLSGMGPLVGPLMILELGLAIAAAWHFRRSPIRRLVFACALVVGLLWLCTFLIQVPLHDQLVHGRSESAIRDLIATNWIRTILWTVRSGLLLMMATLLSRSLNPVKSAT